MQSKDVTTSGELHPTGQQEDAHSLRLLPSPLLTSPPWHGPAILGTAPWVLVWSLRSCWWMKKASDAKVRENDNIHLLESERWVCVSPLLPLAHYRAEQGLRSLHQPPNQKRRHSSLCLSWNPFLRCFLGSNMSVSLPWSHKCQALGCRYLNAIKRYLIGEAAVDIWQWVAKLWFQEVLF